MESETISQYSITPQRIIKELMIFADQFGSNEVDSDILPDSDDEEASSTGNMFPRIKNAIDDQLTDKETDTLMKDIDRMLRMFYLEARVKGFLKEYKSDYFV